MDAQISNTFICFYRLLIKRFSNENISNGTKAKRIVKQYIKTSKNPRMSEYYIENS